MKKNTLIIACSNSKLPHVARAIDLYTGNVFQTLKRNTDSNPLEDWNILILSGKHGLLEATELIEPYNQEVPGINDIDGVAAYVSQHRTEARKLLKQYAGTNLFVVMPNKYLNIFDIMFTQNELSVFPSRYVCRGHRGSTQMASRLKRLLISAKKPVVSSMHDMTIFRSGVSSVSDQVGYHLNRQSKGYSLANVGPSKYPKLYSLLVNDLKEGLPVFLDNGIVTALNDGVEIEPKDVFSEYRKIVDSLPRKLLKSLYLVMPDSPFCSQTSIAIAKKHSEAIRYIARKTNLIVPIHHYAHETNSIKIEDVATSILTELKGAKLILGVPCKSTITDKATGLKIKPRLSTCEIEKLLSLKNGNKPYFTKMHCLGMSEVTRGGHLQERFGLALAYNVTIQIDCCRTSALFTIESKTRKAAKGTRILNMLSPQIKATKTQQSAQYRDYKNTDEWDDPVLHGYATDLIEEDPDKFIELWDKNQINMSVGYTSFDSELEKKDYLNNLLIDYPMIGEDELVNTLKKMFIEHFSKQCHEPTSLEKRAETIAMCTAIEGYHASRQAVQLPLF
ncbi:DUF6884 domain-containing protein [Vibrio sp. Evd11]|uniref:DUF6884 domain-containing protein n=1 Tax=Vibrio sp. Evd11 TaxID=1207404 RepID=UPI000EFC5AB9|nr:DUF6884 domain-containing protein [Vibrio sp. Evd11]